MSKEYIVSSSMSLVVHELDVTQEDTVTSSRSASSQATWEGGRDIYLHTGQVHRTHYAPLIEAYCC